MSQTDPKPIAVEEWCEIAALPEVREAWGLMDDVTPENLARIIYGVKFNFQAGGPGYSGDLYILQGDALTGELPMVLVRNQGQLKVN